MNDFYSEGIKDVLFKNIELFKSNISKGIFFWARNHEEAEYVNWHEGDPSAGSGEDCVFKSLEPGVYPGWYDYGCDKDTVWSKEIHALCEY